MPIVVNNESGLAENLAPDLAQQGLQSGTHQYPMIDAEGNHVLVPHDQIGEIAGTPGYRQPNPEELQELMDFSKYSAPSEQAKAAAEGLGRGVLPFGIATGLEKMVGVKPEDIRGREEVNPGLAGLGEFAGVAGSTLLPGGQGRIMEELGAGAKALSGLGGEGAGLLSRAAATGIKQATEMAIMQSGHEMDRMFAEDPTLHMQNAIADIGMSALLGGGVGALARGAGEPLWEATKGSKLAQIVGALKDRAMGVEGDKLIADLEQKSGMNIPTELRAAMTGNKTAVDAAQSLREAATMSGKKYNEALDGLWGDARQQTLGALGKTEEDLARPMSEFETGSKMKEQLVGELEQKYAPLKDAYEKIEEKYGEHLLPVGTKNEIGENLYKLSADQRYNIDPEHPATNYINKLTKNLENIHTFEDLRHYMSVAYDQAYKTEVPGFAKNVKKIMQDAMDYSLKGVFEKEAPQMIEHLANTQQGYKAFTDLASEVGDRLHTGKWYGPGSFIRNVKEMAPEDVYRRLRGTNDVTLQQLMDKEFPSVAGTSRDHMLSELASKAQTKGEIDPQKLMRSIDKLSPEMKQAILPQGAEEKLGAIREVIDRLPQRGNPSGSAKFIEKAMQKIPGGAGAIAGMLMGHNPLFGWLWGKAAQYLGQEAPDAIKLGLLRAMGSESAVSASGIKSMVRIASAARKASEVMDSGVKKLFTTSTGSLLPASYVVSDKDRRGLERGLANAQPERLSNASGDASYYLPAHATALGTSIARAKNYLDGMRPSLAPLGPLDPPRQPSTTEVAKYKRALTVVQQPLTTLQYIKDGTILPQDIQAVRDVYPELYGHLSSKLFAATVEAHAKGSNIPYATRMGVAKFLGQPMDASMAPQSISLNGMALHTPRNPQALQGRPPKASGEALNQLSAQAATPGQSREQHRAQRGK